MSSIGTSYGAKVPSTNSVHNFVTWRSCSSFKIALFSSYGNSAIAVKLRRISIYKVLRNYNVLRSFSI